MKSLRLVILAILLFAAGPIAFGQQSGELNRFAATALDEENRVSLYPNPAIDYIQVKIENSSLQEPTVMIYNIIGNPVEVNVRETEDNTYVIPLQQLPAGYYFVAIKDEKSFFRETYKFVKR